MPIISGNLFEPTHNIFGLDALPVFQPHTNVVEALARPQVWVNNAFGIYAPRKAGLTRLCTAWQNSFDATYITGMDLAHLSETDINTLAVKPAVIDDCERGPNPLALLSLFNIFRQNGQFLLLGSHIPFTDWAVTSKDLTSRLTSLETLAIPPLNEAVAGDWLTLLAKERQMRLPQTAVQYALRYIDLEYEKLHILIEGLDRDFAAQNKPITRHAIKSIADAQNWL